MKILSGTQMARLDRVSIRRGVSARGLMRRAAAACLRELQSLPHWRKGAGIVILSGPGNNGGDGMAMASLLRDRGERVPVLFFGNAERLSPEARYFHERVRTQVKSVSKTLGAPLRRLLDQADFVVDALFGIGLKRPLAGVFARAIAAVNRSRGYKVAVDIPSGIDADTGEVLGSAVRADLTVTFEVPKWGLVLSSAWDYVGDLRVVPIGLSRRELRRMPSSAEWIDADLIRPYFRRRSRAFHKGRAGRVLIVAGSKEMPGAGFLSARGALRAGAGLVVWALPEEAYRKLDLKNPEVILKPFRTGALHSLQAELMKFQSLAVGPGLGSGEELRKFLDGLLRKAALPRVCDADALNNLAELSNPPWRGAILTPHVKEMARISGRSAKQILKNPITAARDFAKHRGCWVVLKGYRSVIANPHGKVWINSTGGPNLSTAGSGDVLTGILAGLLAQGFDPRSATLSGVFLHGLAGDFLAQKFGDRGTLASDIADALPRVLKALMAGMARPR